METFASLTDYSLGLRVWSRILHSIVFVAAGMFLKRFGFVHWVLINKGPGKSTGCWG